MHIVLKELHHFHPWRNGCLSHCDVSLTTRHEAIPHGTGETFIFYFSYTFSQYDLSYRPTSGLQMLLCRVRHASISFRNTEVRRLPNKSKSTAFLVYTNRHLACNLPVCRGDQWPPNDPDRRHACNCSGWCNDKSLSIFLYTYFVKWEGLWRVLRFLLDTARYMQFVRWLDSDPYLISILHLRKKPFFILSTLGFLLVIYGGTWQITLCLRSTQTVLSFFNLDLVFFFFFGLNAKLCFLFGPVLLEYTTADSTVNGP